MSEDLKWAVSIVMGLIGLIGGLLMRDRHLMTQIRRGDEEAARALREGDDRLHERVNRVRDEFVRREDHDRAYDGLREMMTDARDEQRETNRRLDKLMGGMVKAQTGAGDG